MNPIASTARSRVRGFTLIELLVVMAIISILTNIVLVSVNIARDRANDAAVKSNLAAARSEAEIYFGGQDPRTYVGICGSSDPAMIGDSLVAAGASGSGSVSCNATDEEWAAWANFRSDPERWWCVDASGRSMELESAPAADATRCD